MNRLFRLSTLPLLSIVLCAQPSTKTGPLPLQEYAYRLAKGSAVRIGMYGASTYEGVWSSEGTSGKTEKGAGYWMQYFLNAYYFNSAALVDNSNSIAGSTTVDFLPKWKELMTATSNQVIILGWGINDCAVMSPAQYRENLISMIKTAHEAGRTVVLDTPHQTTTSSGTSRTEAIKQFAEVMRQIAREFSLPLIDTNEWSNQLWRTNVSLHEWISDGMHLSQDGLRAKGALMAAALLGAFPRVSGEQTISTELSEWRIATDVTSHVLQPATRYGESAVAKTFRLAFYVDRPGLDLYVAVPMLRNGGEIEVKVDGKETGRNIKTLNPDMDATSGFSSDVDTMIAENLAPGFHLVELNSSVASIVYYARFAESRAGSLSLTPLRAAAPSGYARKVVPLDYVIRKADQSAGVVLTEIPLSNHLRDISIELSAKFGADEGFVLFASRYGTATAADGPRGGLYVYLNSAGNLCVREWSGQAGYTRAIQLADGNLTSEAHTYTVDVTRSGSVSVQVDGSSRGVYNMTVPREGGFLGFYKRTVGATTVSRISVY